VRSVVEDTLVDALQAQGGAQALVLLDEHPSLRLMISDVRVPNNPVLRWPKRRSAVGPIFA
jgi:hypothetical protein